MSLHQDNINLNLSPIKPAKNVTAGHGWQWINEGFRYFTYSKFNWISVMLTLLSVVMFLIYLFPIFQLGLVIILPIVTAGMGLACYAIEQGRPINVTFLIKGFVHPNSINLVRYGFWLLFLMVIAQIIASIMLAVLGVSQEMVSNELNTFREDNSRTLNDVFESPILFKYFAMSFVVMLPITALNLFAPYILIFSNFKALDSIKYSFIAIIKNMNAIIIYALSYALLFFIAYLVLKVFNIVLYAVFSPTSAFASIIQLIAMLTIILFFAALTYCSAYVAFKQVFLDNETSGEEN